MKLEYRDADWTTSIRSKHFFQQPLVELDGDSWLAISALKDLEAMKKFLDMIIKVAAPMGMCLRRPRVYVLRLCWFLLM